MEINNTITYYVTHIPIYITFLSLLTLHSTKQSRLPRPSFCLPVFRQFIRFTINEIISSGSSLVSIIPRDSGIVRLADEVARLS